LDGMTIRFDARLCNREDVSPSEIL
jgi:hypothetical protein